MDAKEQLDLAKTLLAASGALWAFYGATLIALLKHFIVDKVTVPSKLVAVCLLTVIALFVAANYVAVDLFQTTAAGLLKGLLPKDLGDGIEPASRCLVWIHGALGLASLLGLAATFWTAPRAVAPPHPAP